MKSKELSTIENLPKILVVVGPTASGKTDLAIKLVQFINNRSNDIASRKLRTCDVLNIKGAEIVSADSRQIYRGMDVGTAKSIRDKNPHYSLLNSHYYSEGIPHYLIDIKNPNQPYTVAQYKKDAIRAIKKILKKRKLPILVGGTGLYVKAVVDNLDIPEIKPNKILRKKLEKELLKKGIDSLYKKLIGIDPEAAYIIDRHNPRRIIRALEIIYGSGTLFSQQRKAGKKLFDALKIGLNLPKEKLKEHIYKRVDEMIKLGLINETKKLLKKYPPDLPVFDTIGYREIINYLKDADNIRINQLNQHKSAYGLAEAIEDIKKNTWHYAKRQITWFKKDKEIKWIRNEKQASRVIRQFL